ncbi:alpha/beta-hydrolase [Pholiota conissans]|uniref:Alpha/beta-hydrolase n=1 Tax=Pholiota conissans TaxID=109636 RepID=A0A9P5Z8Q6_9AGAR|nr:alpha/beta-hydrolase [Pholiota conissans]
MPLMSLFSQRTYTLTEEQRRMYASEKLFNFRWISKVVATRSPYTLTEADLVPQNIYQELAELGQFAELAYSAVSIEFLLRNFDTLSRPGFPLEGYNALSDVVLVDAFRGGRAELPVYIVYRPNTKQLIVSIAGTSSAKHILHDLNALKSRHPSGEGGVHRGFYELFKDILSPALEGIQRGIATHSPQEVVLTGHSMGGSVAYLLCAELLTEKTQLLSPEQKLQIAVFGSPRVGDAKFVNYFRGLVASFRKRRGDKTFHEYSTKAYNDGVPALPPMRFGYRHFCQEPLYTVGGKLYKVPSSESEHALFHVQMSNDHESSHVVFPRGGHNYYNGRDLERFARRILWLDKANPTEKGWESRYESISRRKDP